MTLDCRECFVLIYCILCNIVYYVICRLFLGRNEKTRSYFLVLKDSFLLSLFGILYNFNWVSPNHDVLVYFQAYLVCDIVIGYIDYRKHIMKLEGVYHHFVYIIINALAYPRHLDRDLFLYYLILEIPTFIRAVGTVKPEYRSDILFGMSMIVFRVVFHIYLLTSHLLELSRWFSTICSVLALLVHIHWTANWIKRYAKDVWCKMTG